MTDYTLFNMGNEGSQGILNDPVPAYYAQLSLSSFDKAFLMMT
jgi:hypothetical protein